MPLYHYTSRLAAQDISCSGVLKPGLGGKIYLCSELYVTGKQAADALGIIKKEVELAVEIPDSPAVPGLSAVTRVAPVLGPNGQVIRKGGGPERTAPGPISVIEDKWVSLREP